MIKKFRILAQNRPAFVVATIGACVIGVMVLWMSW